MDRLFPERTVSSESNPDKNSAPRFAGCFNVICLRYVWIFDSKNYTNYRLVYYLSIRKLGRTTIRSVWNEQEDGKARQDRLPTE